jgi:flagellin
MGLRINTNVTALRAQRDTKVSGRELSNTFEHLSSGERITKSADDAAGLAVSESLKGQIRGLGQAARNAQDAISLVQVGEGGLVEIGNNLTRLRELAIQAASDNVGERERGFLNLETQQLLAEMQRTAESTEFGSVRLLDGSGQNMEFQVGIHNNDFQDRIGFDAGRVNAQLDTLGVSGLAIDTKEAARASLDQVDNAVNMVAGFRAEFGAVQSRLQSTMNMQEISHENLSAANSRIRDADYGYETGKLTSANIRQQASTAVMAQANHTNDVALRLLG